MSSLLRRINEYDATKEDWTQYVKRVDHFFNLTPSKTVQRSRFYIRITKPGKTVASFMAELRNFGTSLDEYAVSIMARFSKSC